MQDGNIYLAETNLKKILSKYPNNPDALSLLGIIFIHKKQFQKGRDLIESSLLIIANQPQAILNLGLAFYQENRFDEAINSFENVIKFDPDNSEALYCKGLSLQKKGIVDEAINAFNKAISKNSLYMDPIINLGYLYFDLKDFGLAIATFKKGLNIETNNTELLNMIGSSLNELSLYSEAILTLEKSLSINEFQQDALIDLAHAYMCQKDLNQSLELYNKVLRINTDNVVALNNRANVYHLLDLHEKAINDLDHAIKIDKNFSNLYNSYGNILADLERFDEALEKYDLSLDIHKTAEAYNNRGVLFYKKKKYDESLSDFNFAISMKPKYSDALIGRGALYKEQRKYLLALKDFRRALRLNPLSSAELTNIAELYATLKIFDKAYAFHKKAIKENLGPFFVDYHTSQARYNFGIYSLAHKNFSDSTWDYYSDRKRMKFFQDSPLSYSLELEKNKKLWNGSPCRTLVIFGEQGLGDQIITASFLRVVKKICNKIIFFANKKIITLLARSFKEVTFISYEDSEYSLKNISYDFFSCAWDLGKFFTCNISYFTEQQSYLIADKEKTAFLKKSIKKERKKICGLSWKSKNENIGNYKSVDLKDLIKIFKIKELNFVNLQYGDVEGEINDLCSLNNIYINVVNDVDKYDDIDSLASLIDACDFILTTSNITAHIAGALGKETYLLVPYSLGKIWYWHEHDDISIWYPSVKIFRQNKDGSWNNAITSIANQLQGVVNE